MNNIAIEDIRNFVIMGHTGSGKTTLTDAFLFKLGLNDRLGSVDAGSSMAGVIEVCSPWSVWFAQCTVISTRLFANMLLALELKRRHIHHNLHTEMF